MPSKRITGPALPSHCLATGIGSLPHQDPEEAVRLVLEVFPEFPFWPQLPRRSLEERMTRQFDDSVLSPDNAAGFFELIKALEQKRPAELLGIKGQITGPVTWLISNDQNPPCSSKIEELVNKITDRLARNAAWQIERLKPFGVPVVIFLDEPLMGQLSEYPLLSDVSWIKAWTKITNAIQEAGGIAGIHCCDRMDWGLVLRCPVDIISFDAALSFQDLLSHLDLLRPFLDRGGRLSWGIIPTFPTPAGLKGNPHHDLEPFQQMIHKLSRRGDDPQRLTQQAIITPACGLAGASHPAARQILHRAREVANAFRKQDALRPGHAASFQVTFTL